MNLHQQPKIAGVALNNWAYLLGLEPKRRQEAIDLARRAVVLIPREGELHDTLGWLLYQDGQVDLAVTSLSRAASLLPTRPTIRFHLGLAFRAQGELRRARNNLSTAVLLGEFPELVGRAAGAREPHHVAYYLRELAGLWSPYLQDGKRHRVVSDDADDKELSLARLALARAVRTVLANGLSLLGVRAPETM